MIAPIGKSHKIKVSVIGDEDDEYTAIYDIERLWQKDAIAEALDSFEFGTGIPRQFVKWEVLETTPIEAV